ncbi:MAG: hypothetical protein FWE31_04905 [Firmicutes bacterium]|nr:hypothetical protein [Bacillota bacterium]
MFKGAKHGKVWQPRSSKRTGEEYFLGTEVNSKEPFFTWDTDYDKDDEPVTVTVGIGRTYGQARIGGTGGHIIASTGPHLTRAGAFRSLDKKIGEYEDGIEV